MIQLNTQQVPNITMDTLVTREINDLLKRHLALSLFEEKHRTFILKTPPIFVSSIKPGLSWSHLDAADVAGYFGKSDWYAEDYGVTRYKLVDGVRVSVTGLPDLPNEPTAVDLVP